MLHAFATFCLLLDIWSLYVLFLALDSNEWGLLNVCLSACLLSLCDRSFISHTLNIDVSSLDVGIYILVEWEEADLFKLIRDRDFWFSEWLIVLLLFKFEL